MIRYLRLSLENQYILAAVGFLVGEYEFGEETEREYTEKERQRQTDCHDLDIIEGSVCPIILQACFLLFILFLWERAKQSLQLSAKLFAV